MLVYRCVGVLVICYIGVLLYCCIVAFVFSCIGVLMYRCIGHGLVMYWCKGVRCVGYSYTLDRLEGSADIYTCISSRHYNRGISETRVVAVREDCGYFYLALEGTQWKLEL